MRAEMELVSSEMVNDYPEMRSLDTWSTGRIRLWSCSAFDILLRMHRQPSSCSRSRWTFRNGRSLQKMLAVIDEKSESAEDLIVQTGALLDRINRLD
jgi:hypothetical protein